MKRSEIGSGVRSARERLYRRRNLSPTVKEDSFCFFSVAYHRTPCRSCGLEPSSKGGSSLGGKTRSRGDPWREKIGLHMEAITDPSTPAFFREVEASSASLPPVQVPGKGKYSLLRLRQFWLRRVEVHIALRCRFWFWRVEAHIALCCRLALVETAWWLLSSGWLFGSEWMKSRYKVKLSIIGDDDKIRKAESDDVLRDKFDGVEPFGGTAEMRQEEDKPTRAAGFGQCR
ncbi:hypothetical protein HID58_064212 [Brassica napus]|uniref:Uncharacterized protein n=1 Tax=Brassica napus TaxID=3708 RepID=A0ABQ7Z9N3_BRANA|nr:hypothetical protein HID58_064212 [Brassica napus]